MAELKDEELLFLSNLMHMQGEVIYNQQSKEYIKPFGNIWADRSKGMSIGTIINRIDTTKLRQEPLNEHLFDGEISGAEWADMIDTMKKSNICELKLQDVDLDDKKALITSFTDKAGKAYVVFRGTGAGEWEDNFLGGATADTEQQKKALDYINSLDADHITVVGHSKGGNKAKYVALLSDKVDRCVAFDGQGFSDFFIEKYQDRIEANKYKITCYALDNDFVNILLYDIYNKKYYIEGNGVGNFKENHSPNSFFHFTYAVDGKVSGFEFKKGEQSEAMAKLHSFVNYVASTVPDKDRDSLFTFLGNLAAMGLGRKPDDYKDKYTSKELMDYLSAEENSDELGLLIADIIEYEEYNEGITDAIFDIMDSSGMSDATKWLRKLEDWVGVENLLKLILKSKKQINWLLDKIKAPDYIKNLINSIIKGYERKKNEVKEATVNNTANYDMNANDNLRDYSQEKRDLLLKLTDSVANEKPYDICKWDVWYRFEDWLGLLDIDHYKNKINEYYEKVIDINGTSHKQMIQIFNKIDQVVSDYKATMTTEINRLNALNEKILCL
jgi:hypothetical protein